MLSIPVHSFLFLHNIYFLCTRRTMKKSLQLDLEKRCLTLAIHRSELRVKWPHRSTAMFAGPSRRTADRSVRSPTLTLDDGTSAD